MTPDDERLQREARLAEFCRANGFEHTTSCYEEEVGNLDRDTFWVCRGGCPVVHAKGVLATRERAERMAAGAPS